MPKPTKISDLTVTGVAAGDSLVWTDNGGTWQEIGIDPKLVATIERLERNMEKVMERLSVLEDPDPEQLEKFKTLKEAYNKYKFVDGLCGKGENG